MKSIDTTDAKRFEVAVMMPPASVTDTGTVRVLTDGQPLLEWDLTFEQMYALYTRIQHAMDQGVAY